MNYLIKSIKAFTKLDWCIWSGSLIALTISFVISGGGVILSLIASLIGITALIFLAKGNVIAQFLIIVFSLLYAAVSYQFHYYGEMVTYLCMTAPSSLVAAIAWLKNPYDETEVAVAHVTKRAWVILIIITLIVTGVFYFILGALETPNLIWSTVSVTTSFFASALMYLRSQYYATGYMANDLILVILWTLASIADIGYLPMVINFLIFFINDLYGFISWNKMRKSQGKE